MSVAPLVWTACAEKERYFHNLRSISNWKSVPDLIIASIEALTCIEAINDVICWGSIRKIGDFFVFRAYTPTTKPHFEVKNGIFQHFLALFASCSGRIVAILGRKLHLGKF